MNKKIILGSVVGVFVICGVGFAIIANKSNQVEAPSQSTTNHEDGQTHDSGTPTTTLEPDQDIGEIVDLTSQTEVIMNIQDFRYEKPNIQIKKGTTVTWTNQDAVQHNVMLEHEDDDQAHEPPTRDQVDPNELAGPLLSKGESYSFTFKEATASPYHC